MKLPVAATDPADRVARIVARLMGQRVKDPETGCWGWCGQISNSGYGHIMLSDASGCRYTDSVHRVSYRVFIGDIAQGNYVVQSCGNRLCFNPDHLLLKAEGGLN